MCVDGLTLCDAPSGVNLFHYIGVRSGRRYPSTHLSDRSLVSKSGADLRMAGESVVCTGEGSSRAAARSAQQTQYLETSSLAGRSSPLQEQLLEINAGCVHSTEGGAFQTDYLNLSS
ncbi:UNVERIFIED_CONTAM: hypothetical protein FKN15_077291 [Acipenser sinensis]